MQEVQTGSSESGFTEFSVDEKLAAETVVVKVAYNLLMKMNNTTDE